jgi:Tfp pilus assembly protein PilN
MVTNINLVGPETEKKPILTGKTTLVLSVLLVAVATVVCGFFYYLKTKYTAENQKTLLEIKQKNDSIVKSNYVDLADFQERIDLLDKIITDHPYWDSFLADLSQFVLPEAKLTYLSNKGGKGALEIKGTAPNFDVVSRELILLKQFPGADSVELKRVSEATSADVSQTGMIFEIYLNLKEGSFAKE